jgi:hypothetical protein
MDTGLISSMAASAAASALGKILPALLSMIFSLFNNKKKRAILRSGDKQVRV